MPQQKKCTGTTSVIGWTLVSNSCIYQLTLTMDGVPITNTVAVNSGMTLVQIANLLNANRTGNVTGTISVQLSGNDLVITITDIVLLDSSSGIFLYTIIGTGFPCGDFNVPLPVPMSCAIIPPVRKKKRRRGGFMTSLCFSPAAFPNGAPSVYYYGSVPYSYIGKNTQGSFCYVLDMNKKQHN